MTSEYQALPILQFKYGTNKGEAYNGEVILDSTGAGRTDKNYDSKDVENHPVPAGVTSFLSPFTPLVPGTIKVVAGSTVITDDGNGNLTDGGTVDYATGALTFANATAANTTISFEYDNSVIPNYLYPEIDDHNHQQVGDVTISIQPVEMRAYEHKIRAFYGLTAGYRFNKEFGINLPMEFNKQVANEMNKEKERKVFEDMYIGAAGGNAVVWSRTPRPGVSDKDHVESLPIAINEAASEIYERSGKNMYPNFIAAGSNVVAILQQTTSFKANTAPKNGGSFLAGTLGDKKVYQMPSMNANDFLLGVVGNEFWQAGYKQQM